jgi:hypothetical protein
MNIIANAMTDTSIFARIKARLPSLQPLFARPGVHLGLKSAATFTDEFTQSVIADCEEAVRIATETGTPLSPAHRMAMHVLLDSAQIDREREPERNPRFAPA